MRIWKRSGHLALSILSHLCLLLKHLFVLFKASTVNFPFLSSNCLSETSCFCPVCCDFRKCIDVCMIPSRAFSIQCRVPIWQSRCFTTASRDPRQWFGITSSLRPLAPRPVSFDFALPFDVHPWGEGRLYAEGVRFPCFSGLSLMEDRQGPEVHSRTVPV